jgi:hypothetical protein
MATSTNLCSVLVPSCDAYADLWTPFFNLFWKYWPDCPFPVYLGSNQRDFERPGVVVLNVGDDANWTNCTREQLLKIKTPYVLLCLEDFFFRRPVRTPDVASCLEALSALDGHVMRLVRRPGPDSSVAGWPNVGAMSPGAPYRVSMQAAIWNRSSLLALMQENESIWEFEMSGSERSKRSPTGFYGVSSDVLHYRHHVVQQGKWFPWNAWQFARAGIGCDFSARAVMTSSETAIFLYRKSRSMLLNAIPWRKRLRLKAWIRQHDRFSLTGR